MFAVISYTTHFQQNFAAIGGCYMDSDLHTARERLLPWTFTPVGRYMYITSKACLLQTFATGSQGINVVRELAHFFYLVKFP